MYLNGRAEIAIGGDRDELEGERVEHVSAIATEETYAPPELLDEYRRLVQEGAGDLGFKNPWGYYLMNPGEHTPSLIERIQDLGERRLADLAALGADHQVLGVTVPASSCST